MMRKPSLDLRIHQANDPRDPCNTPLYPPSKIQESNDGMFRDLDFSGLAPDYATKKGIFDPARVSERAREVRKWLRNRPEKEIVRECRHAFGASILRWSSRISQ